MSDTEHSITLGGITVGTSTRGGKELQQTIPAGLGGAALGTVVSVTTSATALPSSALTARKALAVRNVGALTVYIGGSGVATTSGFPLYPGESQAFDASLVLYGIVAAGTCEVRVLEMS